MITWEKETLARTTGIQKEKLGVTTHFSETIKLQFGQKDAMHKLCILQRLELCEYKW